MHQHLLPISAFLALLHIGCSGVPTQAPPATQRTVSLLRREPVIGDLGLPLGTFTEIRATVVAGREVNSKELRSSYLLRVTDVGDRALPEPRDFEFRVPGFVTVNVASNTFALYELKTGTKTGTLESEQIAKLEEGYVGKQVRLVVYETGGYSGIPHNLPADVPSWQDHGFGFSNSLVVLAERP